MKPEVEAEVLARFAAPRSEAPTPPTGPELRGEHYTDPDRSEREQALVFSRSWVPLARTSELRETGECRTLDLAGEPLVALRDEHGALRVLSNVCLHRGAQIVRQRAARVRSLRCPYHGFEYGLDGALRACPAVESFAQQGQPGAASLRSVRSAEYGGWLWACLDDRVPELAATLGPDLMDELQHYPLADLELLAVRELEGAFDWKVGVDAFLEPLHVPAIHSRSAHPLVDFRGMAVRVLGEHSRMALPFRVPSAYASDGVLGTAAHVAGVANFPRLNRVQREAHLVYHVFPSLVLMLFPNHMLSLRFLPLGVGRCSVRWELSALPSEGVAARAWCDSLVPGYERLVAEDMENLPWIQRGLGSPSLGPLALSGYEARIAHFHQALARRLDR
jgi:phenylpropionate dioxygenase-like ring-hydroxylating dioxygenase large terminal subunit